MIGNLEKTVLDCPDPRSLAEFYADVLGVRVNADLGDWVEIGPAPGIRQLAFQRVAHWVPPRWPDPDYPQQLHLDIRVADIEEAERAVTALGARRVSVRPDRNFRVFLDPAGHPFCLVYGRRPASQLAAVPPWARQSGFDVRFEWGPDGVAAAASPGSTVVIVDVLRFSTAVEAGVGAGARIYPYRWRDSSAKAFARAVGAVLADGVDTTGPSLSPASLARLAPGARVVLPSPNGSTCAAVASEADAEVVAGCLRNAAAVAEWAGTRAKPVVVIAAGERWPDGTLRPGLEDLVGAGAILARLTGRASPEARAAIAAWEGLRDFLADTLPESSSARELRDKGWGADVDYALQVDVSEVIPVLQGGAFVKATVG